MSTQRRVLLVCLDAAEGDLALAWARDGRLPALASLAARGVTSGLETHTGLLPEASWPSVITGCGPGAHGVYDWRMVRPGSNSRVRATSGTSRKPFWQLLRENQSSEDQHVVLVDVPFSTPLGDDGVTELTGWGVRDTAEGRSWPSGLFAEASGRHRPHPGWINRDYKRGLLSERRYQWTLERLARRRTDLALELLSRAPWDLAVVNYVEPHYAGHAFYHHVRPDVWSHEPERARRMADALLSVYRATDDGLGRLVAAAGDDADVFVFSGRGMTPSACSSELLPRVLVALGLEVPATPAGSTRRLARAKWAATTIVPRPLRHHLRRLTSERALVDYEARAWSEAIDWSRSRAVAEGEPGGGFVRVNLAGREPSGIVSPEGHQPLLDQISSELMALVDADSGQPAVAAVHQLAELTPGPCADQLPDLVVEWSHGARIRRVRHPRAGVIEDAREIGPRHEHSGRGFLVAAGPHIDPEAVVPGARDIDLAPTIMHLMGSPIPEEMEGDVLESLVPAEGPPRRAAIPVAADPFGRRV